MGRHHAARERSERNEVVKEINALRKNEGLGCASDHAQVSARIGLVQTGIRANYNPNKSHRVTYRVSHLWDFNDADSGDTDWYVKTDQFEMERLSSANAVLELRTRSFSDDSTPDGVAVPVNWSDALTVSSGEKARMGVWITDSDGGVRWERRVGEVRGRPLHRRAHR